MTEPAPANALREPLRPIHYLGCKLRMLDAIEREVMEVDSGPGPALDLFSGTGVVAARLAERRPVVATDIQEYSRVLTSALLTRERMPPSALSDLLSRAADHERATRTAAFDALAAHERVAIQRAETGDGAALCAILDHGSLLRRQVDGECGGDRGLDWLATAAVDAVPPGSDTVLTRYYGGVYFGYDQATALDALAAAARSLAAPYRDIALAGVMGVASEIVSSVGNHFAQPVKSTTRAGDPKPGVLRTVAQRRRKAVKDSFVRWMARYSELPPVRHTAEVTRCDYREALAHKLRDVAVVYADPPYTREHYSRYYHVLETIALGDEPRVSTTNLGSGQALSRGLYRADRHQSPFSILSQAGPAFEELFAACEQSHTSLVLSYSPYAGDSTTRPRVMAFERLRELAHGYFRRVDTTEIGQIRHSKLNSAAVNLPSPETPEVLLTCTA